MILYTLLKQDGSTEELAQVNEEVDLNQLYKWLNCTTIELIPRDYYPDEHKETALIWGDEEGRFNSENKRNPHTKVLGEQWDCVGDLVLQQDV